MATLRSLLDFLPTPIKVALWMALSAGLSAVLSGVQSGKVQIDPGYAMVINLALVTARELLDSIAPAATGAKAGS